MPLVWILVALVVLFVVETVLTELESWGWATVVLIATVVGCHFLTPFSLFAFVTANGTYTLVYVLAYLVVGVAWSFVKWFSYLRAFRDEFRAHKEEFLKANGIAGNTVPLADLESFKNYMRNHCGSTFYRRSPDGASNLERPRAAKNKSRITAWMAYWPCSVIGTFLNDPVRRAFNWLFNQFKALYQKMADYVFRNDVELK